MIRLGRRATLLVARSLLALLIAMAPGTADAGWLLLSPPPGGPQWRDENPLAMDDTAPLWRWTQGAAYDTARACEQSRRELIRDGAAQDAPEPAVVSTVQDCRRDTLHLDR